MCLYVIYHPLAINLILMVSYAGQYPSLPNAPPRQNSFSQYCGQYGEGGGWGLFLFLCFIGIEPTIHAMIFLKEYVNVSGRFSENKSLLDKCCFLMMQYTPWFLLLLNSPHNCQVTMVSELHSCSGNCEY